MTSPEDDELPRRHHVPDTFRVYRYTTIYIAFAITVVCALLLWDLLNGPLPHPPNVCPR